MTTRWLRFLIGMMAFAGAALALVRMGDLDWMVVDWSDPLGWLAGSEIDIALAALSRVAGLALLGWIGITTVVYALARLLGVEAGVIDWLSVGPLRRTVDAVLAGYLMLGSIAPAGAAVDPLSEPPPVSDSRGSAAPVDPLYVPVPAGSPVDTNQTPAGREEQEEAEAEAEAEEEGELEGEDDDQQTRRVVVAPGDNLWELASGRLTAELGRSPTEAEIAPYWREVVQANRGLLRSGEPDLIFPGEQLVLPPPDLRHSGD